RFPKVNDGLRADADALSGELGSVVPHGVGMEAVQSLFIVTSVEGIYHPLGDFHVRLRHRLTPLLGKPFGGSTGLIDVAVAGRSHNHVLRPHEDPCLSQPNVAGASSRAGVVAEDGKDDSVAEIENLLWLDRELLVSADPLLKKATNRCGALKGADTPGGCVPYTIATVEA